MASNQGQRRAAKTRKRKGKPVTWRHRNEPPRLPEGVRHQVSDECFTMGSPVSGSSMCSRRGIDHRMVYNQTCSVDGSLIANCVNHGCHANC